MSEHASLYRRPSGGKNSGAGGQARRAEMLPKEVFLVREYLPQAAGAAMHERSVSLQVARYHEEQRLPYGLRKGRAICPRCGRENRAGRYDEGSGACRAPSLDCIPLED